MMSKGACDPCRQRKIRCDRTSPICSPCRSSGVLCIYCLPRRKRGPKPKNRSIQAVAPEGGPSLPTPHDPEPLDVSNSPCGAAPTHEISLETQPEGIISPSPLVVCHQDIVSSCAKEGYTPEQAIERCINVYMQFLFPLLPIVCESTLRSQAKLKLPSFTDGAPSLLSSLTPDMISAIRTYSLNTSLCALTAYVRPCEVHPEHDTHGSLFLTSSQAMLYAYAEHDLLYPTSTSLSIRIFQASCHQMRGNSCLAGHIMDEAIRLAWQMRLHDESSYDGLDPVEAKLRRNAFWFLFSVDRSNAVLKGKDQALGEFNMPGQLTTAFSTGGCPPLLDQVQSVNGGPFEEHLMTGFKIHCEVWKFGFKVLSNLNLFLAASFQATGARELRDAEMRSLMGSYLEFSSVLDDLPGFLQAPAIICEADNECVKHQRQAFWIQRANIVLSYHYLRLSILDRFQSSNLLGVLGFNNDQTAIDLRKTEIAHAILNLVASLPLVPLKANGEPFVEKLRYVCATLLEVTQRDVPPQLLTRAKKHFTALLDCLSQLDSRVSDKVVSEISLNLEK